MITNEFHGGPFDGHRTPGDLGDIEIHINTVKRYDNPHGNQTGGIRRGRYSIGSAHEEFPGTNPIRTVRWNWTPLP